MHLNSCRRPAVAMIELIFAIVIMGIVLMSAPMLISTASQSTSVALQQEGINEAASRISMILTYPWDENDVNESCIPPVLHVSSAGNSALNEVSGTSRRIGIPKESDSRTFKCGNKELNASDITTDGSDDIDDFAGTITLSLEASGNGGTDYIEKDTVNMATSIRYINDMNGSTSYNTQTFTYVPGGHPGSSTNVKQIKVTLTSTSGANELNKTIIFKAFSCNIGGIAYAHREF